MTLFDKRKEKLISELKEKEYRDAFVSEHIETGIPFQIKALREQRAWSQKKLGKKAGMHQVRISVLEDPNYSKFTIATLKKLASAFDIGLVVRFAPISELVVWDLGLSSKSLEVLSFEEEPYFKEQSIQANNIVSALQAGQQTQSLGGPQAESVDEYIKIREKGIPAKTRLQESSCLGFIPTRKTGAIGLHF